MRKSYMLGILLLVIFIVGCQSGELPPEPGEPGTATQEGVSPTGQAYAYYEGYAPPVDVFDDDKQIFFLGDYVFNVDPIQQYLSTEVKVAHEGGYIYRYYYVYTNSGWEKRQFREDTVSGSNWIKDVANDYLNIKTNTITPGENYIVAYSCKKQDNQWRCGCSGIYGQCNQWMLNTYLYRNVDLPPEPIEPGSVITMRVWISPRGEIFEEGDNINLDVYFNSKKYDLEQLGDAGTIRVVNPEGIEEHVTVEKRGDVYCEEQEGQFNCNVGYYAKYTPSMLGEYLIDFGESIDVPETYQIETGYFKVVDEATFGKYLILSDIGGLINENHGGSYYEGRMYFWTNYRNNQYNWVHVNVNLPEERLYLNDWEKLEIDGNIIYVRTDGNEYGSWIDYQWLSGNVRVNVGTYTQIGEEMPDVMVVVKAYLEKWPALPRFENYPDFLIKDGSFNGILVVGDKAPAEDVIGVSEIAMNLQYASTKNPVAIPVEEGSESVIINKIEVGATKLASEVAVPTAQNLILVGRPTKYAGEMANVLIDDFELPELSSGQALLKIVKNGNYVAIIVTGRDVDGPRTAAKVLAQHIDYELYGGELCVKYPEMVVGKCPQQVCTDSDGGKNYYVKGYRLAPSHGSGQKEEDYCILDPFIYPSGAVVSDYDAKVDNCVGEKCYVIEYHCKTDLADAHQGYQCPNGCADGACITGEVNESTCTDTDGGKDYYVKGRVSAFLQGSGGKSASDVCTTETRLLEYECTSATGWSGKGFDCPNGCEDGACLKCDINETLIEGETKTYTLSTGDYEVTIRAITDTETIYAKFSINGESVRSLKEGDSYIVSDGTEIRVRDIIPNEAGDVTQDSVEFCLSAREWTCTDSDGGNDYYVKGDVTGFTGVGQFITDIDHCLVSGVPQEDIGKLGEYYCCNGGICLDAYECPTCCRDGACVVECDSSKIVGDWNEDGCVDMGDFAGLFVDHYNTTPDSLATSSMPGWDEMYDLNEDDVVDEKDYDVWGTYYGDGCSTG